MLEFLGPEMAWYNKLALANLLLFGPLVRKQLAASPLTNAAIRTTVAPTLFNAGVKDNVLPAKATAVINLRLAPGETIDGATAHVQATIGDPNVKITPLPVQIEPSNVSDIESPSFALLHRTIRETAPQSLVAPALLVAATDSRHYRALSGNIFRFLPIILGAEDAFGDMDFKCAGTKDFVTALQLDTKLDGIPSQVLAGALAQAKDARITILEVMAEAIDEPDEMSPYAPRITTIKVPIDKIGEVIGPKGKMINSITEETGASISIEDDGTVFVGATNGESAQAAIDKINAIANPQLPKIGERFLGTVVKTTDFGAFVSLLPGRDGLVHISKLGRGKRIAKVEDVVNVGDKLRVEIADIDNRGKISLILVAEEDTADTADTGATPVDAATASS